MNLKEKLPRKDYMIIHMIISLSVLISLTFVILAFMKSNEVKDLNVQLQEIQLENEKLKDEAVALMEKALEMAAISKQAETEALKQKKLADRALLEFQKCQSK